MEAKPRMLVIREEQRQALLQAAEPRVVAMRLDELREAVMSIYPDICRPLGPAGTRRWIEEAVERARTHGFTKFEDLSRFVHLTFVSGRMDFDTTLSWAAAMLAWDDADDDFRLTTLEVRARREFGA